MDCSGIIILNRKRTALKMLGFSSLVMTTVLWGTSFAFIKLSMSEISPFVYTFIRTLIASLILIPIILFKKLNGIVDFNSFKRGFLVGLAYSTGLCLQAAGTAHIDPSMSAFITGLSTIHVHFYSAFMAKHYNILDFIALSVAVIGLYVLTSPTGGLGLGGGLVFASTIMWALQIILIAKYKTSSMAEFLQGMFTAGVLFGPMVLATGLHITREVFLYLVYLAVVCSIGASFFQVLGQRYISESTAALIFLLEPVFATIFSIYMGLERIELYKLIGGGLILISLYIATLSEIRKH